MPVASGPVVTGRLATDPVAQRRRVKPRPIDPQSFEIATRLRGASSTKVRSRSSPALPHRAARTRSLLKAIALPPDARAARRRMDPGRASDDDAAAAVVGGVEAAAGPALVTARSTPVSGRIRRVSARARNR